MNQQQLPSLVPTENCNFYFIGHPLAHCPTGGFWASRHRCFCNRRCRFLQDEKRGPAMASNAAKSATVTTGR
jgi:hypothetical protein